MLNDAPSFEAVAIDCSSSPEFVLDPKLRPFDVLAQHFRMAFVPEWLDLPVSLDTSLIMGVLVVILRSSAVVLEYSYNQKKMLTIRSLAIYENALVMSGCVM